MSGLAGMALMPSFSKAQSTDPDVVIIGCGAAGIEAARSLMAAGRSVVILEAADRIGGRAYTESDTFGLPYDWGCAWLQGPKSLPQVKLARELGYGLFDFTTASEAVFLNGKQASSKDRNAYWATWEKVQRALANAEGDVSASSVVPEAAPWIGTVEGWIGSLDHGVDFENLSTGDSQSYVDYDVNYLVREGLGTLVTARGHDLPVVLGTPAMAIDWSGGGVKVETPNGTLSAKICIVTVSVGVLAKGKIRFMPDLPVQRQQALHDVPMGLLEKVGLQFDGERFGLQENGVMTSLVQEPPPHPQAQFLTFPTGHEVVVGFIGGQFGWEIGREGSDAVIDFVLEEFVKSVGSNARKHFVRGHFTNWAQNPMTLGAYSAAKPGGHASRAVLAEPLGNRVFFAGEALSEDHIALLSGAHLTGARVGAEVIGHLKVIDGCSACDNRKKSLGSLKKGSDQ